MSCSNRYALRHRNKATQKTQSPRGVPATIIRALVLLNTTSIRKKAAKDCEQVRKKYASAASQWERYQQDDTPTFSHALALRAGPLREEMRILLPKYEALSDLVDEVSDEIDISGDEPSVCLARVEAAIAEENNVLDADNLDPVEDRFSDDVDDNDDDEDDEDEFFKEMFDELHKDLKFGDSDEGDSFGDGGDEDDDSFRDDIFDDLLRQMLGLPPEQKKVRREKAHENRLKELYRELVRALHPDQCAQMTPERMRLWHEVQDAYHNGDLARMEFLHAKGVGARDLTSATQLVSQIQSLTVLFKKALCDMNSRIRGVRSDPAWGFSTLKEQERNRVIGQAEAMLKDELGQLKGRIAYLEGMLEAFRQPVKREKRSKQRKRSVPARNKGFEDFSVMDLPF